MSNISISNQNNENNTDDINPNIITVTTANDENDGGNNGSGLSLREAVDLANNNKGANIILFDSNLAGSTIELYQGQLTIKDSVTLKNTTGESITVDAQNNSRIFNIDDGDESNIIDVNLEELTITGGRAVSNENGATGGGILNQESLTISGVNISNNSADQGGGIDNQGTLNVYNSNLNNNGAGLGGAIINGGVTNINQSYIHSNSLSAIANSGKLNLVYTEIYDNLGLTGGAIDNSSGEVNLSYSNIYNNTAVSRGGAILNRGGSLNITQANINDNSAGEDGGGIYNSFGELELSYSVVSGNTADLSGGGIANDNAIANINYSSITGNEITSYTYDYPGGGGGISVISSNLSLVDSDVNDNEAIFGGGIYSDSATVNIENSRVSENYAGFVGGGLYHTQTELNLTNSTITGNEASFAYGGIGLSETTGNIDHSTISDNTAIDTGGISINTSTGNITNSTVSENIATELDAGGIRVSNATANVNNSTVSNNSADDNGGGIYNNISSQTNLSNSTVSGNNATDGGGIYQNETLVTYDGLSYSGSVNLNSTIVAGNVDNNDLGGEDNFNSNGDNLIGNAEGFDQSIGEANGDIFGTFEDPVDPLLGELQDNGGTTETQTLSENSVAIDSGNNDNNFSTDQRGESFERTENGIADIGAFEVQIEEDIIGGEYYYGTDGVEDKFAFGDHIAIANFHQGEDLIVFGDELGFDDLDTNYSGILDDGDSWITIADNSTIINLDSDAINIYGITDLGIDDFIFGATD